MSFDKDYLTQMGYGGSQGNSIWHYYSATDNLASLAMGTVNTTYFARAFSESGIVARKGDIILAAYCATNAASLAVMAVPDNWDSNGASVTVMDLG